MDADEARSIFDRENYCSLLARLANTNDIDVVHRIAWKRKNAWRCAPISKP